MLHPSQPTPMPNRFKYFCVECAESEWADYHILGSFLCETCTPRFTCRNCDSVEIHYNMRTWRLCDDCATIPRVLWAWVRQLVRGK